MAYRHTQVGPIMVAALAILIVGALVLAVFAPADEGMLAALVMLLAALVVSSFVSLTVEVDGGMVHCRFGPGFISKKIPLAEIAQATEVKNPWVIGWGIRWYPGRCWVWNVSGLQAVELQFKNGRKFRIGTDEPEKLAEAIRAGLTSYP